MIVIRRRPGETLELGTGIVVTVLGLTPSRVKLGIVAPPEVLVVRGEVKEAQAENRAAIRIPMPAAIANLAQSLRRLDA